MNNIIRKFLLAGDRFVLEMHLKQPGFTSSVFGPIKKTKQESKNSKKHDTLVTYTGIN